MVDIWDEAWSLIHRYRQSFQEEMGLMETQNLDSPPHPTFSRDSHNKQILKLNF